MTSPLGGIVSRTKERLFSHCFHVFIVSLEIPNENKVKTKGDYRALGRDAAAGRYPLATYPLNPRTLHLVSQNFRGCGPW